MMYLLIGLFITLLLMTPYGDELKRGYYEFYKWFYLKSCHGDIQEATKFQEESLDKVNTCMNKHLGSEGSQKRFICSSLIMVLVWPILIGCYLLSFVLYT